MCDFALLLPSGGMICKLMPTNVNIFNARSLACLVGLRETATKRELWYGSRSMAPTIFMELRQWQETSRLLTDPIFGDCNPDPDLFLKLDWIPLSVPLVASGSPIRSTMTNLSWYDIRKREDPRGKNKLNTINF
jgi:hypothetical protein